MGQTIDHIEVWDLFNKKSTKLGNVFSHNVDQAFSVTGNGSHQLSVLDIGEPPDYKTLHTEMSNYTVSSSYGVFVSTPPNKSTQATLFPLSAIAVEAEAEESSAGIDHIEVWNGDSKLGDSPTGTALNQWYSLAPDHYTLIVKDVGTLGQVIHTSSIGFTVSGSPGVYVNSPVNSSVWPTTTVPINAYAYEQKGSKTPLIDHIEVWDSTNGTKLGESPTGVGVNSAFINQNVTLPGPGTYKLSIMDINPNNGYKAIHTKYVTVTVK